MVDIVANPEWKSVRILERDEVALGGYGGNMNEQATALVARTELLMQEKADTSDIVQGQYSFSTMAEFDSKKATISANSVVIIDEAGGNQGTNTWNGTTLTKSNYDPLTQAKADATEKANTAKNDAVKTIINVSSNIFNDATSIKENKLISVTGEIVESANATDFAYSDFIAVDSNQAYYYDGFRWVAYYDANKNFISRQDVAYFGSFPTKYYGSYPTPANAAYIRVVYRTTLIEHLDIGRKINKGENVPYEPYYGLLSENINFSGNQREEVKLIAESDEVAEVLRGKIGSILDYIVKSTNLFNAETATATVVNATTGIESPSELTFTSDYIAVTPGETYTTSGSSSTVLAFYGIVHYDANKNFLRRPGINQNGSLVIPSDVYYVRLMVNLSTGLPTALNRMFNVGSTALPYEPYYESLQKEILPPDIGAKSIVYVSKSGGVDGDGSIGKPLNSIQKAINLLQESGEIVILDSGWYRESVNIEANGLIKISSAKGKRAKICGSDQLVVSKTEGYTKVYQASLSKKPVGRWDGEKFGKPGIFEWGTPSLEINPSEYHPLQRGFTHFLPYTQLFEVSSIADVEINNATWFWENGVIYFSATDGGDATLKQYEARVRKTLNHNAGSLILDRIDTIFCVDSYGFHSLGASVVRYNCMSIGNYGGGFLDGANATVAYHDIALGNGADGIAAQTYNVVTTDPLMENTTQAIYFDPWSAKNSDDGCSFHLRGTCTIFGGLMEYNYKGGVIHVSGGGGTCYNTIARGGHQYGFETGGAAADGRTKSTLVCHNTTSVGNDYNYFASTGDVVLECHNAKSIDAITCGYVGATGSEVVAYDCKNKGGLAKSGNVTVINSDNLT